MHRVANYRKFMQREFPDAPLIGVGAVIVQDGRVLLVRRGRDLVTATYAYVWPEVSDRSKRHHF